LTSRTSKRHQSAPPAVRCGETAGQRLQFRASVVLAMRATRGTGEMWNGWTRTRRTRTNTHQRWGRTVVAGIRRRAEGHDGQLGLPWTEAAFQRSSNCGQQLPRCGSSWRNSRRRRPAPAVALGGESGERPAAALDLSGPIGGGTEHGRGERRWWWLGRVEARPRLK
jgi:hypothetical protein